MRTIKVLSLGVILLVGGVAQAHAQNRNWYAQNWEGLGYFHVSFGGQSQDQTFTDSSTFPIYREQGASAAGHTYGGGGLIDIAAGARVWRNFGIGLAYSHNDNKSDATVTVRVPNPVQFGQSREASATASDLEHSENAVHLQFLWMLPLTSKIQIAAMIGPSFFSVRQEAVAPLTAADIQDVPPYTSVSITNVNITEYKDSPVGVNIGIDGTYLITRLIGVGAFVRYSGASLGLDVPPGVTRDGDLKAGGAQAGGGVRLRF